jgi:hypothetical protein
MISFILINSLFEILNKIQQINQAYKLMKSKLKITIWLIVIAFFSTLSVDAQQLQMPQASPTAKISQKVGLTDITIDYSRPSTKGRKIFGELVPFGEVWRTGANAATTITLSTEVKFEGISVPEGIYAIYSIPGKEKWTIILSKNTKLWGAVGYDDKDDVARFTVKPSKLKQFHETMEISFDNMTDTGSFITIKWENTKVSFKLDTEVDEFVMNQIQQLVIDKKSDNPGLLYQAAFYYFSTGRDLSTALDWINTSVNSDPKYWTMHLKAKIELGLGMKKEAISTANKSIELAREAKNPDYVGLNERLIKSIKK